MMTLFWILAGLAASILFARFNEDDSLFWKLAISFIGAYIAANVATTAINNGKEEQKNVVVIDSMPTQVLSDIPTLNSLVTTMFTSAPVVEKSTKPAGKVSCFTYDNNLLSKVHSSARGQPQWYMYFSDS